MNVKSLKAVLLLLNLLLAASAAAAGAVTFMGLIKQELPTRHVRSPRAAPSSTGVSLAGPPPLAEHAAIWNMRATPSDNSPPDPVEVAPVESSEEQIRRMLQEKFFLKGILFNKTNPRFSHAVLVLKSRNESMTIIPGDVVEGAKVEAIYEDGVTFSLSGVLATIEVTEGTAAFLGSRGFTAAVRGSRVRPPMAAQGIDAQGKVTEPARAFPRSRRLGPFQWQIERNELQYLQTHQTHLINEYRPTLHVGRDGKVEGIDLREVPENSYAAQRGLSRGDVIKSVNGIPLTSMDFSSVSKRLRNARTLTFVVERRGRPITLTYNLR